MTVLVIGRYVLANEAFGSLVYLRVLWLREWGLLWIGRLQFSYGFFRLVLRPDLLPNRVEYFGHVAAAIPRNELRRSLSRSHASPAGQQAAPLQCINSAMKAHRRSRRGAVGNVICNVVRIASSNPARSLTAMQRAPLRHH